MTDEADKARFDELRRRAVHFQTAALHPEVQTILQDLAAFCRAGRSAAPEIEGQPLDRDRMLLILGRQQVWLRIERYLNLQPHQLYALYQGKNYQEITNVAPEASDDV